MFLLVQPSVRANHIRSPSNHYRGLAMRIPGRMAIACCSHTFLSCIFLRRDTAQSRTKGSNGSNSHPKAGLSWPMSFPFPTLAGGQPTQKMMHHRIHSREIIPDGFSEVFPRFLAMPRPKQSFRKQARERLVHGGVEFLGDVGTRLAHQRLQLAQRPAPRRALRRGSSVQGSGFQVERFGSGGVVFWFLTPPPPRGGHHSVSSIPSRSLQLSLHPFSGLSARGRSARNPSRGLTRS
jgi:hypothetical protein